MNHFRKDNKKPKLVFESQKIAQIQCDKYNYKLKNIGKLKMVPYKCELCNKIHIGTHYKNRVTISYQKKVIDRINKNISKIILINKL